MYKIVKEEVENPTREYIEFIFVILLITVIAILPLYFNDFFSKIISPLEMHMPETVYYDVDSRLLPGISIKSLEKIGQVKDNNIIRSVNLRRLAYLAHLLVISLIAIFYIHIKEKNSLEKEYKKYVKESLIFNNFNNIVLPFRFIHRAIRSLNKSILRYDTVGRVSLLITVFTMIVVGSFVFNLFENVLKDADRLQTFSNTNVILSIIIVILRTSLLGSFIVTFTIYSYKFSSSSFDQAVRFTKRKHATLFLLQMFETLTLNKNVTSIEEIMSSFKEWNVNVESAFTELKNDDKSKMMVLDKVAKIEKVIDSYLLEKKSNNP